MGQKRNIIYDEAYKVYLEGYSLNQVAQQLNVTRQCVFKAFKKRGFMLRGVNYQPKQVYDGKTFTLRNHGYFSLTTGKRTLMHRYVWEKEKGAIPDNYDIHHLNGIKSDNRIENLECLSKSEHTKRYSPHNNQYTKGRKREAN
jgi:hypothetical protein